MIHAVREYLKRSAAWDIASKLEQSWASLVRVIAAWIILGSSLLLIFHLSAAANRTVESDGLSGGSDFISSPDRIAYTTRALQNSMTTSLIVPSGLLIVIGFSGILIIRYAFRRLEDVSQIQKRFLADASHEMRTPLAIMKTNAEVTLMDKDNLTKEDAIAALESNLQEVNNITRIINGLLFLARYDDQAHQSPLLRVNAAYIVRETAESLAPLAALKRITMHLPAETESFVRGDAKNLEILFKNLLRNAIAYTKSGGEIWVRIRHIFPRRVVIEIEDTGVGIPQEKIPYIFEPFFRVKEELQALAAYNAGTPFAQEKPLGLGLALAQRIVKRHRGTIYVRSEVGKGTRFFISFPLA